jgi:threonine/homoserine/homoserine lactone efflux protein
MSPLLLYVVQGLSYGLAAAAQPGPFQTFVFAQTLRRGWRRALPIALAPLITDGPIIALMLLVLSQLPGWMERALLVGGGLFVLYLAWGAYRSWRDYDETALQDLSAPPGLLRAALVNALSPGPYIFWGTVTGPLLIAGWREDPAYAIGLLVGFYVAMVGTLVASIVLVGTARRLGAQFNRALLGISAAVLAGFGIFQLWKGLSGG